MSPWASLHKPPALQKRFPHTPGMCPVPPMSGQCTLATLLSGPQVKNKRSHKTWPLPNLLSGRNCSTCAIWCRDFPGRHNPHLHFSLPPSQPSSRRTFLFCLSILPSPYFHPLKFLLIRAVSLLDHIPWRLQPLSPTNHHLLSPGPHTPCHVTAGICPGGAKIRPETPTQIPMNIN